MIRTVQCDLTYIHTNRKHIQKQEQDRNRRVPVNTGIIVMKKRRKQIVVKRAVHTCS